jgi:hypothetical protein
MYLVTGVAKGGDETFIEIQIFDLVISVHANGIVVVFLFAI